MAKTPIKAETASASDTAEAQVVSAPIPAPAPASNASVSVQESMMGDALGPKLNEITTPEAAVAALKAKTGILHTVINNVGHFGSLAFNDVEQLIADIRWLTAYIRSKV